MESVQTRGRSCRDAVALAERDPYRSIAVISDCEGSLFGQVKDDSSRLPVFVREVRCPDALHACRVDRLLFEADTILISMKINDQTMRVTQFEISVLRA